jgi:hypothetical protein
MAGLLRNIAVAAALLLGAAGQAGAVSITGFGDPLTNAALVGGAQETFDAVASGQYASITLGNVTYTGVGAPFDIDSDFIGGFNTTGTKSMSNDFDLVPAAFRFDFATAVNAFAFNWGAADNSWLLQAFNASNTLLESFLVPGTFASNNGEYFGLATAGIKYATLTDQKNNIQEGDYVFIDRFTSSRTAAVPEPASMLLLGAGLASAGIRRRRARKA